MSDKSLTFVLVAGSYVVAQEYDKVVGLLKQAGHNVQTLELLSVSNGERQPPAQTSDDVDHIRSGLLDILDNQNSNVVLGMHSYGGIPGSAAADGLDQASRSSQGKAAAVIGLLYIAAFMPVPGESLRDIMNKHDALQEPYKTGVAGEYLPSVPADFAAYIFNDVKDPEEISKYYGMMQRQSSDSYGGAADGAGWKQIKSVQIVPELDLILPVRVQESMGERARKEGRDVSRVFLEGAGHCPNVSRPEVIVQQLVKLAGSSF